MQASSSYPTTGKSCQRCSDGQRASRNLQSACVLYPFQDLNHQRNLFSQLGYLDGLRLEFASPSIDGGCFPLSPQMLLTVRKFVVACRAHPWRERIQSKWMKRLAHRVHINNEEIHTSLSTLRSSFGVSTSDCALAYLGLFADARNELSLGESASWAGRPFC